MTMKTHEEMRSEILEKAKQDQDFRSRLLDDPNGAIETTLGITVPDTMSVRVHQDTATTAHLVLPPSAQLDAEDLELAAGGHVWKEGIYSDREVDHSHPART